MENEKSNVICKRCHRKLKDENSKKLGFGKICYEKYMKRKRSYLFEMDGESNMEYKFVPKQCEEGYTTSNYKVKTTSIEYKGKKYISEDKIKELKEFYINECKNKNITLFTIKNLIENINILLEE